MDVQLHDLLCHLLLREEWRGSPANQIESYEQGKLSNHMPPEEAALVAAAAAIGSGEPKRALVFLRRQEKTPGDAAVIKQAFITLALAMDRNWFPGGAGAVLEPGDAQQLGLRPAEDGSVEARRVVRLAADVLTALPTWRFLVAQDRFLGSGLTEQVLRSAANELQEISATPLLAAPANLLYADLLMRAGQPGPAFNVLEQALGIYHALGDASGVAACQLMRGDWAATPFGSPELMDEDVYDLPLPQGLTAHRDIAIAADYYRQAANGYTAVGAQRGMAAVALRQAHLAAPANPQEALRLLKQAHAHSQGAGDGALSRLAVTQRALIAIRIGTPVDTEAVVEDLAEWASNVGSSSFARGLGRLCLVQGRRLRADDVLRGHRVVVLGGTVLERLGGSRDAETFTGVQTETYLGANYRRAALMWTVLPVLEAQQDTEHSFDTRYWVYLVDRVVRANSDAVALRDPDALRHVEHFCRWLLGRSLSSTADPSHSAVATEVTARLAAVLENLIAESTVFIPLYQGVRKREQGDLDDAERDLQRALAQVDAMESPGLLLRCTVLATMGHRDEAFQTAEPILASATLPPDSLATFFVRLGRHAQALDVLRSVSRSDSSLHRTVPWELPALEAEAWLGCNRADEAAQVAEKAVSQFRQHLARLSRDVLRTMASDDLGVAGLYTTAIRAHAVLSEKADPEAAQHMARSFELSDESRGAVLGELLGEASGEDPSVLRAVHAWQRAGAFLGATIEELTDLDSTVKRPPRLTRQRLSAAERDLDAAEAMLQQVAPHVVENLRRMDSTPSVSQIQEMIPRDALLVQYHAFDDELITWTVTSDRVRTYSRHISSPQLRGRANRFLRTTASRSADQGEQHILGAELAELLLGPMNYEMAEHERIILVPHGALSALPFHILPWGANVLGTEHVVSYLPASSLLHRHRDVPRTGRDARALLLGDPLYAEGRGLCQLPGASVEAIAIGALRGQQPLINDTADYARVITQISDATVIHLATHGWFHERAPYSAGMALAGEDTLTVPDLMGLRADIDLAVLSACDSGRGHATASGDLIGLTRALIAAGARQLVVSMWPVDDQLACLTMVFFHEELMHGLEPATALATAQRKVRKMTRKEADELYEFHREKSGGQSAGLTRSVRDVGGDGASEHLETALRPFYWAPFVHIGG